MPTEIETQKTPVPEHPSSTAKADYGTGSSIRGKTILVVEDEKPLRDVIVNILHLKNFQTLGAENGEQGVEMALSEHPDLILLDLLMPVMDGMTALKKIREDAWGAKVPVIILTNLNATSEQLVEDIVTHKPINYLIKSDWKLHDVVAKIENILEKQDAAENTTQ